MRYLLSLCDLHFYVVVGLASILVSVIHAEQCSAVASLAAACVAGAIISGVVFILGFLGLCPFELGLKGVFGWSVINLLTGSVLVTTLVILIHTIASVLRLLKEMIF